MGSCAAQMPNPESPEAGDYQFRCLRWECGGKSCTAGKSPTDFLPPAYFKDSPPEGCQCTQTMLGPVFQPADLHTTIFLVLRPSTETATGKFVACWMPLGD